MFSNTLRFFYVFDFILLSLIIPYSSFSLLKFSFIILYLSFSFKILINSSWLISRSINACDIHISMLLSLLLANIIILSCFFFLLLVIFNNFLNIPVVREKCKVRLALVIPTGAPIILLNEIIDTPLFVALKAIKILFI